MDTLVRGATVTLTDKVSQNVLLFFKLSKYFPVKIGPIMIYCTGCCKHTYLAIQLHLVLNKFYESFKLTKIYTRALKIIIFEQTFSLNFLSKKYIRYRLLLESVLYVILNVIEKGLVL